MSFLSEYFCLFSLSPMTTDKKLLRGLPLGGVRGLPHGGVRGRPHAGVRRRPHCGVRGRPHGGVRRLPHGGVRGRPHGGVRGSPHGGVSVLWRKSVSHIVKMINYDDGRIIGIEMKTSTYTLLFLCCYLPYECDMFYDNHCF